MQPYSVLRKALDSYVSYVKSLLSLPYLCVNLSFPLFQSFSLDPSIHPFPTGLQGKALTKRTSHLPVAVLTGSVSGGPLGHATFCWCPQRAVRLASRSILKGLRWPRGMMGTSPQTTHQYPVHSISLPPTHQRVWCSCFGTVPKIVFIFTFN